MTKLWRIISLVSSGRIPSDPLRSYLVLSKGRAALALVDGIKERIQDCQNKVTSLRKEFDTAVDVDTRNRGMSFDNYFHSFRTYT